MTFFVTIGRVGSNVNTDMKNGVIKRVEDTIWRPVHLFVCVLHSNELPLRHLLNSVEGKTSGPRRFTRPFGKQQQQFETKAVESFTPFDVPVISIGNAELNTDKNYMKEMYDAVSCGLL